MDISATVTAQGQMSVPAVIRHLLGECGQIVFHVLSDGTITIAKADLPVEEDCALKPVLSRIERDLEERPETVQPVTRDLHRRAAALVDGVAVDLDAPIPDDEA